MEGLKNQIALFCFRDFVEFGLEEMRESFRRFWKGVVRGSTSEQHVIFHIHNTVPWSLEGRERRCREALWGGAEFSGRGP